MLKLKPKEFARYKFLNSMFLGLSSGSIFTIYATLKPSIYSVGGIGLAIAMILVAKMYEKILNIYYFYRISLFVELVVLILVLIFLIKPYYYATALAIYIGYQLTFTFGSYLVRAETLIAKKKFILTLFDTYKQYGYLAGLVLSFLFYKVLESYGIDTNQDKVYDLHFLLLLTEIFIIAMLINSFEKS